VLTEHPGHGFKDWTLDFFAEHAADVEIQVEVRDDSKQRFGRGKTERMTVGDFCSRIKRGDRGLYLTTQEIPTDESGAKTDIAGPPLTLAALRKDWPNRLGLLETLALVQANIWIGSTMADSRTGLHHDYHDNLYVLLKGKKKFRIWSPSHAFKLQTSGEIQLTFPNGNIAYEENFRADGANLDDVDAWMESKLGGDDEGDPENEGDDDDFFAGVDLGQDDFEDEETDPPPPKRQKVAPPGEEKTDGKSSSEPELPDNFSRLSEKELEQFSATRVEFELSAGEMLFLPAGWFHEVFSCNADDGKESGPNYHFAFNFWFAPPVTQDFERPYIDDFWKDWHTRLTTSPTQPT